jgi:hypothetical protein
VSFVYNVAELIEELKKYPSDALVGTYHSNSYNKGDPNWISLIQRVSLCKKKRYGKDEVVQLVSDIG